jgi:hypothetical protein
MKRGLALRQGIERLRVDLFALAGRVQPTLAASGMLVAHQEQNIGSPGHRHTSFVESRQVT